MGLASCCLLVCLNKKNEAIISLMDERNFIPPASLDHWISIFLGQDHPLRSLLINVLSEILDPPI